jgi:hypothetical protein
MSINSVFRIIRQRQQKEANEREATRILGKMALTTSYTARTTHKVARLVLWHGTVMCQDRLRTIKAKRCGLGLYDVWTETAQ